MGEVDAPVGGGKDHVFDANARPAGDVDARLDRDDTARLKRNVAAGLKTRVLVNLYGHTVTGAVPEVLAVAGVGDDVTRRLVGD